MSSKEKIWRYLIEHNGEATNAELADWLRGSKGQLSFGQRIRELRQDMQRKGGDIICIEKKVGIYLYRIVWPEPARPENEQAIADNNLAQENKINQAVFA